MSSLTNIADVALIHILERCDFKSLMTLRKTCKSLREFISDSHLKTDLSHLCFTISQSHLQIHWPPPKDNEIQYHSANGLTLEELKTILSIQSSKLDTFDVSVHLQPEILDDLEEILKSKPRPLQTEKLVMRISSGSEILRVLPYLDPKILKRIEFLPSNDVERKILDGMDRIFELEQFKNAVGITVNGFVVKENLRNFFHFERIRVKFQHISFEDLVALKVAFTTSTHMKYYALEGHRLNENLFEELFDINGFVDAETEKKSWWCKIQKSKEHVLKVKFVMGKLIFRRKKLMEMPEKARVMDSFIGNF